MANKRNLILTQLATTLATISNTVVKRQVLLPDFQKQYITTDFPTSTNRTIIIVEGEEEITDYEKGTTKRVREFTIPIYGLVKSTTPSTSIDTLMEEIKTKIDADKTIGGNALYSEHEILTNPDSAINEPYASEILNLRCRYYE